MPPMFSFLPSQVFFVRRIGDSCFKPGRCAGMVRGFFHRVSPGVMNRIALRASQRAVPDPDPENYRYTSLVFTFTIVPHEASFFISIRFLFPTTM